MNASGSASVVGGENPSCEQTAIPVQLGIAYDSYTFRHHRGMAKLRERCAYYWDERYSTFIHVEIRCCFIDAMGVPGEPYLPGCLANLGGSRVLEPASRIDEGYNMGSASAGVTLIKGRFLIFLA